MAKNKLPVLLLATVFSGGLAYAAGTGYQKSEEQRTPQSQQQSQEQQRAPQSQDQTEKQATQEQQRDQQQKDLQAQLSEQEVMEVQRALQAHGYYLNGEIDGIQGPQFKQAVTRFQREQYFPATGQLDQRTVDALGVSDQVTIDERMPASVPETQDSQQQQDQQQQQQQEQNQNMNN